MALPIVEAARTRLAGRPLVGLLDDAVITLFELYPVEQKVLAALLLAEGNILAATELAGTSEAGFKQALDNLAARQLLSVKAGVVDLSLMQAKLRVQTDDEAEREQNIPQPRVVLQGVRATAFGLAKTSNNPGAALGRVYAYLYGRTTRNYAVLGKIAAAIGGKRAVELMLAHMFDDFGAEDPLMALLPQAIWMGQAANGQLRGENSPDQEEQAKEIHAEDRASWEFRMQRWLDYGSEEAAFAGVQSAGYAPFQMEMLLRQVRLDYARYREAGEPSI
jgi:hypothetical protein